MKKSLIITILPLLLIFFGCSVPLLPETKPPEPTKLLDNHDEVFKKLQGVIVSRSPDKLKDISTPQFAKSKSFEDLAKEMTSDKYKRLNIDQIPEGSSGGVKTQDGLYGTNYLYYVTLNNGDTLVNKKVVVVEKTENGNYLIGNVSILYTSNSEQKTNNSTNITTAPSSSKPSGTYLYNGAGNVAVAISERYLDEALDAAIAKDYQYFDTLIYSGKLMPVKDGTRVTILDTGMARTKIRISEGAFSGQTGWVQTEFVKVQ